MAKFFGSVEGRLVRSKIVKKPVFRVYDECTANSLICYFPPNFLGVPKALGKRVNICGEFYEREDGRRISIKVKELEVLSPNGELPTTEEIVGVL